MAEKGLGTQPKPYHTRDDRSTIHSVEGHAPISPTRSLPSVSLRRQISPPVVSLFGGVSPDGLDAEEGFGPVRSREEEVARQMEREGKGPDPWAVKFEPGEKINPKVSRQWSRCCSRCAEGVKSARSFVERAGRESRRACDPTRVPVRWISSSRHLSSTSTPHCECTRADSRTGATTTDGTSRSSAAFSSSTQPSRPLRPRESRKTSSSSSASAKKSRSCASPSSSRGTASARSSGARCPSRTAGDQSSSAPSSSTPASRSAARSRPTSARCSPSASSAACSRPRR